MDKNFDWTTWGRASKFVESPEHVTVADETTIRRLFTTHLRQERFCEGHLVAMFENGHVVALLQRLKELADPNMMVAAEHFESKNYILVVAARNAWPEYQEIHAYVCQPNRTFQNVDRVAFYSQGYIRPLIPRILESHEEVKMVRGQWPGRLGKLVEQLLSENRRVEGESFKVLLLSAPESPATLQLLASIPNDLKSASGKPTAFTRGHRYVASEQLLSAKATSDLLAGS
ncbi:MAG: hypothetical protein IAF94_15245 [Pirellulaceae bacterium]|nr:hypothetical protein [Pirellulaceae bacterium]